MRSKMNFVYFFNGLLLYLYCTVQQQYLMCKTLQPARSSGNITDEMIEQYLKHHKEGPNSDQKFILE